MKQDWQSAAYPYKRVKDDPRFIEHAKNNQWADRRAHGYPWKMDIFQFIANEYGFWLDTGRMVQADFRDADPSKEPDRPLYNELHKRLANGVEMPAWLNLPSKADKVLADAKDDEERKAIGHVRAYFRAHKKPKQILEITPR